MPTEMNKIAFLRHGAHDEGILNSTGHTQMQWMGSRLKQALARGESGLVLASTASHVAKSAEVLAELLGSQVEYHSLLRAGHGFIPDLIAAFELIEAAKKRAELLTIVTHTGYVEELPAFVIQRHLHADIGLQPIGIGQGVLIHYNPPKLEELRMRQGH